MYQELIHATSETRTLFSLLLWSISLTTVQLSLPPKKIWTCVNSWEIGDMIRDNAGHCNPVTSACKKLAWGPSLVAQWLRICLPIQGTRVRALVWEDPACRGATGPVSHSYWACALEPVLRSGRGRDSERPAHRDEEWPPLAATGESPRTETKTQHSHR